MKTARRREGAQRGSGRPRHHRAPAAGRRPRSGSPHFHMPRAADPEPADSRRMLARSSRIDHTHRSACATGRGIDYPTAALWRSASATGSGRISDAGEGACVERAGVAGSPSRRRREAARFRSRAVASMAGHSSARRRLSSAGPARRRSAGGGRGEAGGGLLRSAARLRRASPVGCENARDGRRTGPGPLSAGTDVPSRKLDP